MQQKLIRFLKSSATVLCTVAVLAASAPFTNQAFAASLTATTTDYLNLRQSAGTNAKIILTLTKNASVTVLDDSDSQWAKVRTASGYVGYCSKQYLNFSGSRSSSSSSSSASSTAAAKTTAALNMRTGPSMDSSIVTILSKGTSLKVLDGSNSQWAKVQTPDGKQGWCFRQYLSIPSSGGSSSSSGSKSPNPQQTAGAGAGNAFSSLKSDTPYDFNMKKGANYTYKFTGAPHVSYTFACGTGSVARTVSVKQQGGSYYFKICAVGAGRTGVYASAAGVSQHVGVITVVDDGSMTATTTDYVNLRKGAGMNYAVILTMSKGTTASVLDNSNSGWVRVQTSGGKQGWCSRQYVKISGGRAPAPKPAPAPDAPKSITGATVTASLLRLRAGAGTSYGILDNLSQGTYLKALGTPQSGWIKVQTAGGKIGYVSTDYVKLLYNGDAGTQPSGGLLSASSATVPQGKTLWLTSSSSGTWTSSNTSVATVTNGYVFAVSPGTAQITVSSGSVKASCAVTVAAAEPVRATYASPNIAAPGETVTLTAVTDTSRDGVRFSVNTASGVQTLSGTLSKEETTNGVTTKVWTASLSFPSSGVHSFTASSSVGGSFSSGGTSSDVMIATQGSESVTTSEQRRASDKMLNLIANWEGYSSGVYADQLASSHVPTIGYGYTFGKNAVFYDNISRTEAWALLVNAVNRSSYTTELNRMISNNHFLMNQNQADALISFAYNVGASYFNRSDETDFRRIMKNAVVPPSVPYSGLAATVTYDTSVRADHNLCSNPVCGVSSGTQVTVTGTWFVDTKDVWYAVRLSNGATGWINSGYVNLSNSDSLVHDLNYTNAYAFGSELILWNQAGGKFIPGLFYRRLGEANIYNYGDYSCTRDNRYNYTYPASASNLS